MGGIGGREKRRLAETRRANRQRWAEGGTAPSELHYQQVFDAAVARSGLAVPPLYPFGSAANASLLYLLFRLLEEFPGRDVLELGAGQSTVLLDALAAAGRAHRLTTLEHDPAWAAAVGAKVRHEIVLAPLVRTIVGGIETDCYSTAPEGRFDIVLVDGPVGTLRHARRGALPLLDRVLGAEFVVLFDDAERPGEQQTIEAFLARHPEAGHRFVHAMKCQCLVFTPAYRAVACY